MQLYKYPLLFVFACACGCFITLSFYLITKHAWLSCFVISTIAAVLTLENSSLLSDMRQKEEEIEVLRAVNSEKLLHRVRQMEVELNYMRKDREKQRLVITNLRLMHKLRKSGSF